MIPRLIKRLDVRPSVRQVEANEAALWRYLNFLAVTVLLFVGIEELAEVSMPYAKTVMRIFALVLTLAIFRPWHRHLRVDVDSKTLWCEWRILATVPFGRRSFDLSNRRLGVGVATHTELESKEDPGLGCLVMALPFPFNLAAVFRGQKEQGMRVSTWSVLCVANPEWDRMDDVVPLADPDVATLFLDEVREILPASVEPAAEHDER